MNRCQQIKHDGQQCTRQAKDDLSYCRQHAKIEGKPLIPVIDLYEFKIEHYSNKLNKFRVARGFGRATVSVVVSRPIEVTRRRFRVCPVVI